MNAARARVFWKVFTAGFAPFTYFTSEYPLSAAMPKFRHWLFASAARAFVSGVPNGSAQELSSGENDRRHRDYTGRPRGDHECATTSSPLRSGRCLC